MTTNRSTFSEHTTAEEVLEGINMTDKIVLVTGGSGGLGLETARALAKQDANVIVTMRNKQKTESALAQLRSTNPKARITPIYLELGDLVSIRSFAEIFLWCYPRLHVLINNAGVMACPQGKTIDGFETQIGINHLGHFALTRYLAPSLFAASGARVITVSSRAHHNSDIYFEDLHCEQRPYDRWQAYGQSKTANILFTVELDRRWKDLGVRAFSLHPGVIETDLARHLLPEDQKGFRLRISQGSLKLRSTAKGAATTCFAASAPELNNKGGLYLEDCAIAPTTDDPAVSGGVRPYAMNLERAKRLWDISETVIDC